MSTLNAGSSTASAPVQSSAKRTDADYFREFITERSSVSGKSKTGVPQRNHTGICRLCVSTSCKTGKRVNAVNGYANFAVHVRRNHEKLQEVVSFLTVPSAKESSSKQQAKLESFGVRTGRPYSSSDPTQKRLVENVAKVYAKTACPLSILEDRTFDDLVKDIDPKLTWPSRRTISRRHQEMTSAAKENLKQLLQETEEKSVALCIDIWSSRSKRGYLGMTVHFLDRQGNLRRYMLACPRFSGTHKAEDISVLAVEVIAEYDVRDKLGFIGVDNGPNILKAFEQWMPGCTDESQGRFTFDDFDLDFFGSQLDFDDLDGGEEIAEELSSGLRKFCSLDKRNVLVTCAAHTLQLVLKKPAEKCRALHRSVEKSAAIISKINKSNQNHELVQSEFGGRSFRERCRTRWNTNHKMASVAVKFDWNTTSLPLDLKLDVRSHSILKEFVELTEPFEEAFLTLQEEGVATIASVIPISYRLRIMLEKYLAAGTSTEFDVLQSFARDTLDELNTRFAKYESDTLYIVATFWIHEQS